MTKGRLEAFSDGVIAVIITIMVLEIKVPHGTDLHALGGMAPQLVTYLVSFVYVGIYWANHHHLLHATEHIGGGVLWANLGLLFWLSLVPVITAWVGENPGEPVPTAVYGVVLLLAGVAWLVLQQTIIARNGRDSKLAQAIGRDVKGKVSAVGYCSAIGLAFVDPRLSDAVYTGIALMWLVPDRRIERKLASMERH